MDAKRFIVGSIVGGIVVFGLGALVYNILLGDFLGANLTPEGASAMRTPPLFWAIGLGCLLEAALICYVLGARGATGVGAGASTGVILGLLVGFSTGFFQYAATNSMNMTGTIVNALVGAVMAGIAGAVIGFVLAKMKPA